MARSPARHRPPAGRDIAACLGAPRRLGRSGPVRVWALTSALAGVAAWLFTTFASDLQAPAYGVELPWWALAALFFATEMCVVHFEFKREAHTFSLGEVALVLGLFFLHPPVLLLARILGSGAALVLHRRRHASKLGFNLANLCLEVVVAALVWHAVISLGDPRTVVGWVAALAATVAASCSSVVLVAAAISLMEGRLELETIPQTLPLSLVVSAASASLGLIGATLLYVQPLALWLVMAPAALTFAAYRSYASIRRQRDLLELLHHATSVVHHSNDRDSVTEDLLVRTRHMFAAESAELRLFSGPEETPATRFRAGADGRLEHDTVGHARNHEWARTAMAGRSTLVARTGRRDRLLAAGDESVRDAMVAPVYGDGRVTGMLAVSNRLSDVSTFDEDELRLLETLANHMGVSLENARLIDELKRSLARLTELNRLKDDFVASVSHELRTPLTSIRGYVDLLLRAGHRLPAPERRSMLESVDRQSEQLWNLIEDLLVASGVESPPAGVAAEGVCIRAVVERVVARIVPAGDRDRFCVDLADLPPVRADAPRLERIVAKLVDNAVKHSDSNGAIRVEGRLKGDVALIAIEDEGPGIPAVDRERIFDRFYQVDQSSTRPVGGAGLGLYICRRLAESLGGRVWLERSDETGSRFCLALATTASDRTGEALSGIRRNT